ncbi:MAG: F0F1 ATP synthase subunit beta [Candidatus Saccharibacteria bacterium]
MLVIGNISSISGLIVDVLTTIVEKPLINTVLYLEEYPDVILQVIGYNDKNVAKCLNLSGSNKVYKGAKIISSEKGLTIPVGDEIIGHVFDSLGRSIDVDGDMFSKSAQVDVFAEIKPDRKYREQNNQIVETGIKVLDFFTPFIKGRKIGIVGGAGVGKTVLTTEIMHNIGNKKDNLTYFVGIGERMREGHELYNTLKAENLLESTVIYLGQMNENAALRSMVGPTAARSARYFRDKKQKDILFFIDNIYRHVQANNELSSMVGELPAEGGYQPSMYSDLKKFMEQLDSNENGSITTVQSVFIPSDDLSDPAVVEISQQLDAVIVLSRSVFENGIFPAVDLLQTNSSLISENIVGKEHYELVGRVKAILQKYESLKGIIAVIGESELSQKDRSDYHLAQKLIKYFTQSMFVTQDLNGSPGEYISREDNLKGVRSILDSGETNE